ncbi:MAG: ABC transporter ATP-binding protein, partial [Burkholderiales bacterium]
LWHFVRRLNRDGHTVVLTTHYLEEAESLCTRIAMLKAGRVVALDSTRNLLAGFSGLYLKLALEREALPESLPAALAARLVGREGARVTLRLESYAEIEPVLGALREAGIGLTEFELEQPDLEEVFMSVMGRP